MSSIDTSRDFAEFIPIPREKLKRFREFGYDKAVRIVLYGPPYSDSRPRPNLMGGVQLENMNRMKKSFGEFYKRCKLLQELVITSHYHMECKFYLKPTVEDLKMIERSSEKINMLYKQERLGSPLQKDVDNMLKIHNDILFEPEFYIVINDTFNMGFLDSAKYISEDPRAEIVIYYSSRPNNFYKSKILKTKQYRCYLLSEKDMRLHNRDVNAQVKHMRKVINDDLKECKNENSVKALIKRVAKFLEYYSAEMLKKLADVEDLKFTRYNAIYKLLLVLFGKNKTAIRIITNAKDEIQGMGDSANERTDYFSFEEFEVAE